MSYSQELADAEAEIKRLRGALAVADAALAEIRSGDGVYYVPQETAFAPGISGKWPPVIPAPHTPHGRLVRRGLAGLEGA